MNKTNINARVIEKLLSRKHHKDIFVPECKTGGTWNGNPMRLDAWVMTKSWANPVTIGYEIKISRQDFLRDEKWVNYLNYCTDFYFVAPQGIIDPNELSPQVGLLVTSKNHKRLFTKKKCIRRGVEIPNDIFKYILMWRVGSISSEHKRQSKYKYWAEWLALKDEKKKMGYQVSRKIRNIIKTKIEDVELQNMMLKKENARLQEIKGVIQKLGLDPYSIHTWSFKDKLKATLHELETGIPGGLSDCLEDTIMQLNRANSILKKKGVT